MHGHRTPQGSRPLTPGQWLTGQGLGSPISYASWHCWRLLWNRWLELLNDTDLETPKQTLKLRQALLAPALQASLLEEDTMCD
jgi:hypothetical protein